MTPETKFHTLVLSATVAVMFWAFVLFGADLSRAAGTQVVAAFPIAVLASAGTYTLFAKLLSAVLVRSTPLKRFVLGPSFLGGTWVGWVVDGDVRRWVVEHFDQDLQGLVIRGWSWNLEDDGSGAPVAEWQSDASHVDPVRGRLSYAYQCKFYVPVHQASGLGFFSLQRKKPTDAAHAIRGSITDVLNDVHHPSFETKVADEAVEASEAIRLAKDSGLPGLVARQAIQLV